MKKITLIVVFTIIAGFAVAGLFAAVVALVNLNEKDGEKNVPEQIEEEIEEKTSIAPHDTVVCKEGRSVAEGDWCGYRGDDPVLIGYKDEYDYCASTDGELQYNWVEFSKLLDHVNNNGIPDITDEVIAAGKAGITATNSWLDHCPAYFDGEKTVAFENNVVIARSAIKELDS